MRTVRLRSGEQVSAIGQGTWYMGDRKPEADREVAALVEDSVKQAKSSAKPLQADLLTDVYISY